MDLLPWERDYYVISYDTDPPLIGTVAAKFDDDTDWIDGTPTDGNWAWLIAGPDWVAEDGETEDDTDYTVTKRVVPQLKLVDDPVTDGKNGPPINLKN